MRDPSQSILVLYWLGLRATLYDLIDTSYIVDIMCATTVLREMKYSNKLFFSGAQLLLRVQFGQFGPELWVFVVPDDERGAAGEELGLPALVGDGNHRHPSRNTGLHTDGGVLEDEGVVRRGAEQVERPEVGSGKGLERWQSSPVTMSWKKSDRLRMDVTPHN